MVAGRRVGGVHSAGPDGGSVRAEPAETVEVGVAEGVPLAVAGADGGVDQGREGEREREGR